MANNPWFTDAAAEASLNSLTALLNTGFLAIYSGTQPADANQAITGTVLATMPLSATAFATSVASGSTGSRIVTATANSITTENASNTGTAGYFILFASNGTTVVAMGSAGTTGCDLNLSSTSIVSGSPVAITSLTITQPE